MIDENASEETNPNDGTWVIRDTITDQVCGFVVGDKTTVAVSDTREFVAIETVPVLEKREFYYRYDNGNFTHEPAFENEHYSRVWYRIRAKNYPPITDFADAWVKQDEAALEAYRQACLAVKSKYPKPE